MSLKTTKSANSFLAGITEPDMYFDVAVVGGGTAGAFAAISAARAGAKTVILERSTMLGGTSTNGGVNFPGLFHAYGRQIIAGPCWEAIERAAKLGGAVIPEIVKKPVNHWDLQVPTDINIFNRVMEEMCTESGVTILYYSTVFAAVETSCGGFDGVMLGVAGINGCETVFVKKAIDCTGDANLAYILGYDRVRSEILQPCTIRNILSGYDIDKVDEDTVGRMADEAFASGELDRDSFWGWKIYDNLRSHTINTHIFSKDGADSLTKTELELKSRSILFKFIGFFHKIPGLENLKASYVAPECGVRETYRIKGKTFMSVENYCSGYVYPDAVCYGYYPVDLHMRGGIDSRYGMENELVPTIPYSALIPVKDGIPSRNVLVAGRCISADQYTMSAIRVEAPCMAEGQAAGCAAAICAVKNLPVEDAPYDTLCGELKKQGCIVPE